MQRTAKHSNTLQYNTLQHAATFCSLLQQT